jgi:hypothetical protein
MRKPHQQFIQKAKALLLSLGAKQHDNDFVLQTKAGRLTLRLVSTDTTGLGSVFARFDDPQRAGRMVNCNRLSGRWNHHYVDGWTVETAIDGLSSRLKMVLGR